MCLTMAYNEPLVNTLLIPASQVSYNSRVINALLITEFTDKEANAFARGAGFILIAAKFNPSGA